MRRRRLALRQIAETTQDVSDIDGDDSDAQQRQQSAEAPTFNLLTVTTGAGVASTAILLSDDDVDDATLLQHERSARPSPMKSAATKPIQSTNGDAGEEEATVASSSSSIFHLYQEGLAPDQVLQLAFTRRRAPRSSRSKDTKPGDDFVLPLPTLSIRDLLPSADVNIRDLFASDAALRPSASSFSATNESASEFALHAPSRGVKSDALASAKAFFSTPETASLEERRSWQAISESEWHQLYQELQKGHSAAAVSSRSSKRQQPTAPSFDAVCVLLRASHSDALASFVWESLLLPVLEALLASPSLSSLPQDRDIRMQEFLRLLLRQDYFRAMAPKEFRARVRAKRLREQLSDAAFGAHVELQLLALYHSNRQSDWPA